MEPPINMDRMREASLDDHEFMCELIGIFLDDAPRQVESLRQAIERQDSGAVLRTAHRIKGASTNLGADSLAALCARLEQDGRSGHTVSLDAMMERVDSEFARVSGFLEDVKAGRV